ncbi:MAG: peptidase U32 family protein [Christensenellaceae bacterium]|jgi:putative protease
MKKVELLAPAGNMECLETALRFGADAVYLAGKSFGLRAFAGNFSMEALQEALAKAHEQGKRIYVTVNALLYNEEIPAVEAYLQALKEIGVDAVIISDPGILPLCKKARLEIHISTQMSTMNYASALFWYEQGASRIVMAREASLAEISYIHAHTPEALELEAFVHGAMCVAHSGRCLLSSVMTGRSGNRGACAQPCRWEYTIHEAGYPEEYYPIMEDSRGTYVLNSRDLMMIAHVPALIESGIASFKIEGRMKSVYYVASVVSAYRHAIDAYYAGEKTPEGLIEELSGTATRGFTTGFYFDKGVEATDSVRAPVHRDYVFCGVVKQERNEAGLLRIEQRNKFVVGDTLRVLSPTSFTEEFVVETIMDEKMNPQESAPHPQQLIYINCPCDLAPGDMLRVKREKGEENG